MKIYFDMHCKKVQIFFNTKMYYNYEKKYSITASKSLYIIKRVLVPLETPQNNLFSKWKIYFSFKIEKFKLFFQIYKNSFLLADYHFWKRVSVAFTMHSSIPSTRKIGFRMLSYLNIFSWKTEIVQANVAEKCLF